MSRPTPRRSSSRAATPRPRKLAGGRPPTGPEAPEDAPVVDETAVDETEVDEAVADETPPPATEAWPDEGEDDDDAETSLLKSARVTRILLAVAAGIALILIAEAAWAVISEATEDDPPKSSPAAEGSISVPEGRPVQPTQLAWQEGVEAAAKAAQKVVGRTFQNYDQEVEEATALMTPDFAEEYTETTGDVREEFVARKTTVDARVVGQGVVRANDTELQALLYIDSYVMRGGGQDPKTTRTPYRAVFTMINTDAGWLVDNIDTQ
jgi:Mce-associated membrane protein